VQANKNRISNVDSDDNIQLARYPFSVPVFNERSIVVTALLQDISQCLKREIRVCCDVKFGYRGLWPFFNIVSVPIDNIHWNKYIP
jgi:hypothetical protein